MTRSDDYLTSDVFEAVLVEITDRPRSLRTITRSVSEHLGRPISFGHVSRCLARAVECGCAVRASVGWHEPADALSAL